MSVQSLVLIPTFNEIENISALLLELMKIPNVDVLVIDDNSPDGTAQAVRDFQQNETRVHLLNRPQKAGLALAYLSGFEWGFEKGYTQFVQMDADFSHSPNDVPHLLKALESREAAMGCRYIAGGGISGWGMLRKAISRGGNLYAQAVLNVRYKDMTGGFNAWRKSALEKIDLSKIRSRGYAYQVEMKYRAHKAGIQIAEVPIHFENRTKGVSKMSGNIVWEAAGRVLAMRRTR